MTESHKGLPTSVGEAGWSHLGHTGLLAATLPFFASIRLRPISLGNWTTLEVTLHDRSKAARQSSIGKPPVKELPTPAGAARTGYLALRADTLRAWRDHPAGLLSRRLPDLLAHVGR